MSEEQSEEKQEVLKTPEDEVEVQYVRQVVAEVIRSEQFSGPIPPPKIIKGYEEVLPGAADRILTMAEKQSNHRQEMEKIMIKSEARDSLLGILFAFALGIGCIIAAVVIVFMVPEGGGALAGSIFGVTGICSIIATFIKSTRSNKNTAGNEKKATKNSKDT